MGKAFDGLKRAFGLGQPNPKEKNFISSVPLAGQARDSFVAHRNIQNPSMGIGGSQDIINNTYLDYPFDYERDHLTAIYLNSWVASKIIDLLVDDVFSAGIIRKGIMEPDDDIIRVEEELKLWEKLPAAVKAGRLYGTAFLIIAPKDGNFRKELDLEMINKDDIGNLIVADRFSMYVYEVNLDPAKPDYGKPHSYMWNLSPEGGMTAAAHHVWTGQTVVHASRCVRFDGIASLIDEGWKMPNNNRWGYSVLTRVMDDILLDMLLSATGGDVAKRVAVPILKIKGFRDMLGIGDLLGDEVSPDQYAISLREHISSNRMAFIDAADEMQNLEVGNPEGVVAITESQIRRLANAAGIPVTRFTGASATGLNATGSGDARDYRMAVESYRERDIAPQVKFIMDVIARTAGEKETPEWEWGRLGEMTAQEQAETLKTSSESVSLLLSSGLIDKKEGRKILNQLETVNVDESYTPPDPVVPPAGATAGAKLGASPTKNPMATPKKKPPLDKDM